MSQVPPPEPHDPAGQPAQYPVVHQSPPGPQQYPSAAYQPQQVNVIHQQAPGNGFAIASLILAVVGICVGIIPFFIGLFLSFLPCVLGITFGILGIVRANRIGGHGFGIALAGLVIAGINFLLYFTGYGIFW